MAIVTRFAPSPTGFLHIGGARTALFNWLYAKSKGGQFLLRIEDTDRNRSSNDAIQAILDGLKWLGLEWDGDPVSQAARGARHKEIAETLLSSSHAYRCYASKQELDAMREKAQADGRPPRYDGTWRDRDPSDAPDDTPFVIRFRAPQEGETVVNDHVQGDVTFPNADLDDLIILRSDGTPTYNLSVVVDDHDMGITHIVRGVDHLTNAARQSQIYRALDWNVPEMAHIPLIHGPDGAKLSKRHGALGVGAYREMGYLPEAMRNYLARLGWSHGDDEIFSTEQMVEWFDLRGIGKSAARFDTAKLENLNGHYIRQTDDAVLADLLIAELPHLPGGADVQSRLTDCQIDKIRLAIPGLKERAKTLCELLDGTQFLLADRPLSFDEKAAALLTDDTRPIVANVHQALSALTDWSLETIEQAIRDVADAEALKLGKVAQPLRAALTGRTTSPGIFDVVFVLGREETLGRLADVSA